jgi:hypothetical protein
MREPVSFSGILRGNGQEAHCTVRATKVGLPGEPSEFRYVDYSIHNVSEALQEGVYQLSVDGDIIAVRHQGGHWLSAS